MTDILKPEDLLTPQLVKLLSNPANLPSLPVEAIAELRGELARLDTLLLGRLMRDGNAHGEPEHDHLLTVKEAAEKMGTTADWLYRNADTLFFAIRVGKKQLRFSESGIDRWIRRRASSK